MFILKKAVVNKYKSYTTEQEVQLESDVTTLVGKNESGKTAFLEVLAKLNYFTVDKDFEFDEVYDYPRSERKKYKKSGEDIKPIVCTFKLDQTVIDEINDDLGEGVLTTDTFDIASCYGSGHVWYELNSDEKKYLGNLQQTHGFSDETKKKIIDLGTIKNITETDPGEDTELQSIIDYIKSTIIAEAYDWKTNLIDAYIVKKYINPRLPRFWYFDEYYELPSRVSINSILSNTITAELTKQQLDTR